VKLVPECRFGAPACQICPTGALLGDLLPVPDLPLPSLLFS